MSNEKTKQPMTEVDALSRIEKVLNQLTPTQRKRVLEFLAGKE
jgi:hypothetical protein